MRFSRGFLLVRSGVSSLLTVLAVGLLASHVAAVPGTDPPSTLTALTDLERQFREPPPDARVMVRWWWFGPAVTSEELDRELRAMRDGGFGGFEVQPVYPLTLDDADRGVRNLQFLSGEFRTALRFVALRARELGLRMDVTMGSGWPYGGPQVSVDEAAGKLRVERIGVPSGVTRVTLPDIGAGERLIAVFVADPGRMAEVRDVADGVLTLSPPAEGSGAARRELLVFISSRTWHDGPAPGAQRRGIRAEPL